MVSGPASACVHVRRAGLADTLRLHVRPRARGSSRRVAGTRGLGEGHACPGLRVEVRRRSALGKPASGLPRGQLPLGGTSFLGLLRWKKEVTESVHFAESLLCGERRLVSPGL